jgi:hypothetical protein
VLNDNEIKQLVHIQLIHTICKLHIQLIDSMGGFHRAGTGKNKKVIEISPLKGQGVKIKKNHIFGQKWPILNFVFVFST